MQNDRVLSQTSNPEIKQRFMYHILSYTPDGRHFKGEPDQPIHYMEIDGKKHSVFIFTPDNQDFQIQVRAISLG